MIVCRDAAEAPPQAADAPLRIALTSPFAWPWVRRGAERTLNDLGLFLSRRGHEVTVFSTGPEDRVERREGVPYHLLRRRFDTGLRQFNGSHEFALRLQGRLAELEPDVVFAMSHFDAYAALRAAAAARRRFPVVFFSVGVLTRRYFRAVPLDAWLFRTVARDVAATVAVSRFAARAYESSFGRPATCLYPPVHIEAFAAAGTGRPDPPAGPRLVFPADADDRRKGARLLCRALPRVLDRHPGARLLFAGNVSGPTREELLGELRRSGSAGAVDFAGLGRLEELPGTYRDASAVVLPAVEEAFGMSLVESLAAGTPVVGARHGGIPEIVDAPALGELFDPGRLSGEADNEEGLAGAILAVLARGKTPGIVRECRESARRFDLEHLGPRYEDLLRRVAGAPARPPR